MTEPRTVYRTALQLVRSPFSNGSVSHRATLCGYAPHGRRACQRHQGRLSTVFTHCEQSDEAARRRLLDLHLTCPLFDL